MIRINFVKEERKKIALPDISKLKEIQVKELFKERFVLIVPVVGAILIIGEIFYAYELKQEINTLRNEINNLSMEKAKLKRKADAFIAQKRALEREINDIRRKIRYLEMSKGILLTLKNYYAPFNSALSYFQTNVPSTVWYDSLSQTMDFQKVNVELKFGSYDIGSIEKFYNLVKKEFPQLLLGEVKTQQNKVGIIYYVSSIQAGKELIGGEE